MGVRPKEIVFTSGGSESSNLAIRGLAERMQNKGKHIITSIVEHASVYECCKRLENEGYEVTYLPVDHTGAVRLEDLQSALTEDTFLVSIMYVNNETGRIQPVERIGKLLKDHPRITFHVDAVQAFTKLPLEPAEWGIDMLSVSAHKLNGPKGAGFLYRREGVRLEPLILGGGQEHGLRSGTENVPGIVGMAKSIRMAMENRERTAARTSEIREMLEQTIQSLPELALTGPAHSPLMAPHIVHFRFPGMKSEVVVHALEKHGMFISTRSACSSEEEQPSRVLVAMGLDRAHSISGLRISYSGAHTLEEAEQLCGALRAVVRELAPIAAQSGRRAK